MVKYIYFTIILMVSAVLGIIYGTSDLDSRLKKGETVIFEKGDKITTYSIVDSDAESFFNVITDYNSHKKFMPNIEKSKVIKTVADTSYVKIRFSVAFNDIDYTLKMVKDRENNKVYWTQYEGEFKKNNGCWEFEEYGDKLKVKYDLDVIYPSMIPKWIRSYLTKNSLPDVFEAVEKEIKKRK